MKAKFAVLITIFIVFCTGYWIYEKEQEKEEKRIIITTVDSEADSNGSGASPEGNNGNNGDDSGHDTDIDYENPDCTVFAYICGEVSEPGVYEVSSRGRIIDVLNAAGGFTENAATDFVNLAEMVQDGMRVYIPSVEETQEISPLNVSGTEFLDVSQSLGDDGAKKDTFLININLADITQLTTLPGIGKVKAEAIVSYRETNGEFKNIHDIVNVKGIGESTFESISDLISVK